MLVISIHSILRLDDPLHFLFLHAPLPLSFHMRCFAF
jgi:hypothetical protein